MDMSDKSYFFPEICTYSVNSTLNIDMQQSYQDYFSFIQYLISKFQMNDEVIDDIIYSLYVLYFTYYFTQSII